jgi:hypothetical protein
MTAARTAHCTGHTRHLGICPACQRARLLAEQQQLAEVRAIRVSADTDRRAPVAAEPTRSDVLARSVRLVDANAAGPERENA